MVTWCDGLPVDVDGSEVEEAAAASGAAG
jgi:hypothetical protein